MQTFTAIKHTVSLGFISAAILLIPTTSRALTVEEVTNPRKTNDAWVTDMANILSDRTEAELNRLIGNLEAKNGTEIAVVTVPETAPADSPKTFATELFNYWGIGKAESDNGILFLVSTGDRRVEIETGYGIEAILSNNRVAKIIETEITPQYKQGNYDGGTLDGTVALINSLDRQTSTTPNNTQTAIDSPNLSESAPNHNWHILAIFAGIGLTSAGGIVWLKQRVSKVYINPSQAIVSLSRRDSRDICCAKCQQPMQKVKHVELNRVQQVAKKIGAVSYRGYQCSDCNNPLQPYSLVAYTSRSSRYQKCSKCEEFTMIRTSTVSQQASYTSEGETTITDTCHCCEYVRETTEITPRLRHHVHANNQNYHNSGSGSYSHTYTGGGYSGGSSGGGFGGGSSGGGGAGGDF